MDVALMVEDLRLIATVAESFIGTGRGFWTISGGSQERSYEVSHLCSGINDINIVT